MLKDSRSVIPWSELPHLFVMRSAAKVALHRRGSTPKDHGRDVQK
jgi:hypothetical protein